MSNEEQQSNEQTNNESVSQENTPRLKAEVGKFDGVLSSVGFSEGDTVAVLFQKANFSTGEGETINNEEGDEINFTDKAINGATYYIVGNYKQGN